MILNFLLLPLAAYSQTSTSDEGEIVPILECVSISPETGNLVAVFGYNNPSKTEISVPPANSSISCANAIVTGNNIHVFKPGRVFSAFSVEAECSEFTWTVIGPSGKPKSVTANLNATFCATSGNISPNIVHTGKTFSKIGAELTILYGAGSVPTDYVYQIEVVDSVEYVFIRLISLEGKTIALASELNNLGSLEIKIAGQEFTCWFPASELLTLNESQNLRLAMPVFTPIRNGGAVSSQGDRAQRTDLTRTAFAVQGEGVKSGCCQTATMPGLVTKRCWTYSRETCLGWKIR